MEKMQYNPILLFKCQGDEQSEGTDDLGKDDFALIIQTEFQRDALKKYGNNVILVDSTHGLTQYNFYLTTVMVIDEHGEGLPVSFAITNREDTTFLVQYFKALRNQVEQISCSTFMSDCADQFFTAWISVFGKNATKRLLCRWHVDRAWCKALNKHVAAEDEKIALYHQLCVLMEETEEAAFARKLQQFMSLTHNNYSAVHQYFKNEYIPKVKEWATCHRIGTAVNTNMFLESFNRLLKVVYFDSKHNRRVDQLIHVLIKLSRNLVFEQIVKTEKGKLTHRKCEINKRHKEALDKIGKMRITAIENGWKVESLTKKGKYYTVEKQSESCSCLMKCLSYSICPHMYSCSCLDACLHHTVCKHLHLIQMQLQPDMIAIDRSNETHSTLESNDRQQDVTGDTNAQSLMKYLETAPSKGNTIKASVKESVYKVMNLVQDCNDSDILQTVKAHMLSAISLMEATTVSRQSLEFSPTIKVAPNTNNLKQELFSTKKSPTKRKRMAKPTEEEKDMIKSKMAKESAIVCAVCWEEDDSHDNDEPVNWVKCDSCDVWIHIQCMNNYDMNSSVYCNRCCNN